MPGGSFGGTAATGSPRVKWYKEQRSVSGGAFLANVLMLLQDEPLDAATIFTSGNGEYGLISHMGEMFKTAYAFKAFSELVNNTPVRIEVQYNKEDSLVICAGTNKEKTEVAILISNFTSSVKNIVFKLANSSLTGSIKYELYAVDETHDFSKIKNYEMKSNNILQIAENIEGPSVVMLKLVSAR